MIQYYTATKKIPCMGIGKPHDIKPGEIYQSHKIKVSGGDTTEINYCESCAEIISPKSSDALEGEITELRLQLAENLIESNYLRKKRLERLTNDQ